jgi:cysteine desulfurase
MLNQSLEKRRFYFDYNATSPLAPSVKEWLAKGDFVFGNPSSAHFEGRQAAKILNETEQLIKNIFSPSLPHLIFHSGATEGINGVIKGHALKNKTPICFYFFQSDHKAVLENKTFLTGLGHHVFVIPIKPTGDIDTQEVQAFIDKNSGEKPCFLNWTWANNETGVVHSLAKAELIKKNLNCFIHVDGAQIIGKFLGWQQLSLALDAYTFSGHKIGALLGTGWTFLKNPLEMSALIHGGDQQLKLRSGTINLMGVYSLALGLQEQVLNNILAAQKARDLLKDLLTQSLQSWGVHWHSQLSEHSLSQTLSFSLPQFGGSDLIMAALDIKGVAASKGSACQAGLSQPSHVLAAMGLSPELQKSVLRLSFNPKLSSENVSEYHQAILLAFK